MIKLDTRRLTGINVIWKHAGAVVDVRLNSKEHAEAVISSWNTHSRQLLDAIGWGEEKSVGYPMHSGVALAISAPMDALYAAVEVADWLFEQVKAETAVHSDDEAQADPEEESEKPLNDLDPVARLKEVIKEESNPALQTLLTRAQQKNTTVLCDDDEVSIGLGRYSTTWPVDQIPVDIDWNAARDVPTGLVTGTNGKTTTVRLTQRMLRAADLAVGISSTDWIGIDDTIIDRGDYSGPGGARAVLRQPIDAAILETARGGLLRRGLGMPRADVALITNIAEDHLGDFGSESLQELLNLKWIVTQALDQSSIAVLNAQDDLLLEKSAELEVPICWFSIDPAHPKVKSHIGKQLPAVTVVDDHFSRFDGKEWHNYCRVSDAPLTVDGSAKHNVVNALGAIALAHYLGASDVAINHGLTNMLPNDNPGRCNFFTIDGVDVLLDFAHNPSAMQAIFDIAAHHKANNRFLCFGQAGDRTDNSIRKLARNAWDIGLKHVFISELAEHRRGREPDEVFNLLSEGLMAGGAERTDISHYAVEKESLDHALAMAKPGDLVIILALAEARSILAWLEQNAIKQ
ncbi:MAG: Mur ligase family protein [Gammaproteobacteria bacterium]